ncbi:MAG: M50 family metallopeptidase, partial [Cyanobacteria bacterium J06632_22]
MSLDQRAVLADAIARSLTDQFPQVAHLAQISVQGAHLHIGLAASAMPTPEPVTNTLKNLLSQLDLSELGLANLRTVHVYGLTAPKQAAWRQSFEIAPLTDADTDLMSFENRFSAVFYFPLAVLIGILLKGFGPFGILLRGIDIWFHEFGHAVVAWMSGRRAIPLPIGFTPVDPQRSVVVYFGVLILLGLLYWAGQREQKRWPQLLALGLAIVQFGMTWLMSAQTFDLLLYFGGIGGEFMICALLIVSYYFSLPQYFQWGLYRYPVVVGASFTFFGSLWDWRQV